MNVCDECVAFLDQPNPGWANGDDCGDFPCSFPNNVFLKFNNASGLSTYGPNFKVIHHQDAITTSFDNKGELVHGTSHTSYL
jgi:hypothetical protein